MIRVFVFSAALALFVNLSLQGTLRRNKVSTEWDDNCGVSRYEDAGVDGDLALIVNGWEARIHEFPWQAGLRYRGSHSCGGIIINSRWVLTAAHCVDGRSAADITIRVGDHDWENPTPALMELDVELYIMHENYDETGGIENDIAVIKVDEDIPNYENVTAGCKPNTDYGGAYGSASGWGRLQDGGSLPTVLNYVNNPVLDQQECIDCFSPGLIKPGMLCWGYCGSNDRSTCNGDSGGPLSIRGEDDTFQVIGLTSFNVGGCVSQYPKVFTNITYFVPWVEDKIAVF